MRGRTVFTARDGFEGLLWDSRLLVLLFLGSLMSLAAARDVWGGGCSADVVLVGLKPAEKMHIRAVRCWSELRSVW